MCDVGFEHENNINYMTIKGTPDSKNKNYQVRMLESNSINGLLPIDIRDINSDRIYYYNISGRQRVTQFYEFNKIRWNDVKNICLSISEMVNSVNEYMLDTDCVMLEPEYMFIDVIGRKIEFAYYTGRVKDFSEMLRCLFEYILEHYDHSTDKQELMCVYEMYQKIIHGEYNPAKLSELYICNESSGTENLKFFNSDDKDASEHINTENALKNNTSEEIEKDMHDNDLDADEKKGSSHVLHTVQKEYVGTEYEKESILRYVIKAARAIALLVALYMIGTLVMPSIRVIQLGFPATVVITAILLWAYVKVTQLEKSHRFNSKVVSKREGYSFSVSDEEIEAEKSEKPVKAKTEKNTEAKIIEYKDPEAHDDHYDDYDVSENTVLLSDYIKNNPDKTRQSCVLAGKDGNIVVDELPCIIGSMKKRCTKVIDSELVSRMHMCICSVEEGYSIEDMNSTNGTFLNEERIMPGEKKIIHDGDVVKVGSLLYTVEIS